MSELNIHLQEGFDNDTVTVRVGGREVYRRDGVTTRTQLGLADMVVTNADPGSVDVEIDVPTRSQREVFRVTVPDYRYLGVSLDRDGRLTHRLSSEIMGYV